jgi:hypothetical protein
VNGPSPEVIRRALRVMADAYNELDLDKHYTGQDRETARLGP